MQLFRWNSCNEILLYRKSLALRNTIRIRFGKAGAHPQLAWESQLPLKPCISLQPSDFEGNCDSLRFSHRFLLHFIVQFDLLRKCGLLAHTSAAFLKNCCTEKLLFACGSLPAALYIFPLQKRAGRTALLFLMLHLHLFDFSVQSNL